MPLLRTRVLVPCGVALFVLSGCFGSTDAVLPCAVPASAATRAAGVCGPARPHAWGRPGDGAPLSGPPADCHPDESRQAGPGRF